MMILTPTIAWLLLMLAGIAETVNAVTARYADGFTRPLMTVVCLASGLLNIYLLSVVFRVIPIGTAYAVWVGLGVVGTVAAGAFLFHDRVSVAQIAFIFVILAGIIGVKLT